MAFSRDIPEPWYSAMAKAGFTHAITGEPAVAPLAEKCKLSQSTIHNVIDGTLGNRGARPETLEKIARALGVRPKIVAGWVNKSWGPDTEWVLPDEANMLSLRERAAINEMIRCLAANRVPETAPPVRTTRKVTGVRPAPAKDAAAPTPAPRRVARKRA